MADETVTIYKYLDKAGLSAVWEKIKTNFASKAELASVQNEFDADIADINTDIAGINTELNGIKESISSSVINSADEFTIQSNSDNKFGTAIALNIDTESQTVQLIATGKNATDDNKVLSAISYKQFVKDGILNSVELVVIEESTAEREAGTYLKFTFNTDAGKDNIYVNVSELINVYVGEGYIVVNNDVISLDYTKLTTDLEGVFVKLDDFNQTVTSLNETIAGNASAIEALQAKLGQVESKVADNTSAIEALQAEVNSVKQSNEETNTYVASLNETISQNSSQISLLWEKLGDAATKEELAAVEERISTNETDINALENRLASLEGAVNPDGDLVTISINQVTDFAPMTEADITEVCTEVGSEEQTVSV